MKMAVSRGGHSGGFDRLGRRAEPVEGGAYDARRAPESVCIVAKEANEVMN